VTENDRVKKAASALKKRDVAAFGELMADSHRSLRDDYEVSTPELDLMVDLASAQEGVYGARMTGGGFGGCTINLVDAAHADHVQQKLEQNYQARTGLMPTILICAASDGAGAVAET
jgi:galactokinase